MRRLTLHGQPELSMWTLDNTHVIRVGNEVHAHTNAKAADRHYNREFKRLIKAARAALKGQR